MIDKMPNMRPGDGLATGSGPVKLRTGAAGRSAGTPFRIPAPDGSASRAAADPPASGVRPTGKGLPPGAEPDGTLRIPRDYFPADAGDPAAVAARRILERVAARFSGDAAVAGPLTGVTAEIAAGAVEADSGPVPMAGTAGLPGMPADLLPDLDLEFPAAPIEPRSGGLMLLTPPPGGSAASVAASGPAEGLLWPGSGLALQGQLPGAMSDPLANATGSTTVGNRLTEWSGVLPSGSAGSAFTAGRGFDALPALPATASLGDSAIANRASAESLATGLMAGNGSSSTAPAPLLAGGPHGTAGNAFAAGLQAAPPGVEAMAGLRQAMADLTGDGGRRFSDPRGGTGPAVEAGARTEGAGFLSALGLSTASPAAAADRPMFMLPSPPGSPEFADQVAERVVWMTGQKLGRAQIRLNPAHLGPISVDVSMGDDGANITFTAQHAVTREALEQALPRLREMFSGSGLALAGADVSGQGPDAQRGGDQAGTDAGDEVLSASGAARTADTGTVTETPVRSGHGGRGLIDTYV